MVLDYIREYPLPGPEIQLSIGNGNNNLPAHVLMFHMGVGVIITDVVPVHYFERWQVLGTGLAFFPLTW